ncbi:hypothetical protein C8Q74DRAFT_1222901 [Fomes fomentarius]|nr:hypothetical protein C8Q74DRAFT_1222901 [Fomes fomentarius]
MCLFDHKPHASGNHSPQSDKVISTPMRPPARLPYQRPSLDICHERMIGKDNNAGNVAQWTGLATKPMQLFARPTKDLVNPRRMEQCTVWLWCQDCTHRRLRHVYYWFSHAGRARLHRIILKDEKGGIRCVGDRSSKYSEEKYREEPNFGSVFIHIHLITRGIHGRYDRGFAHRDFIWAPNTTGKLHMRNSAHIGCPLGPRPVRRQIGAVVDGHSLGYYLSSSYPRTHVDLSLDCDVAETRNPIRLSAFLDQLLVYHARALDFVQEICHRINALPSINRLPVELLVEIFKYATHCEQTSLHDTTPPRKVDISPLLTLIAITHVCRRWRDVATGTPMLWNRFRSMPNDSLLKLFLERSGNAPLTVGIIVKNKGRKVVDGVLEGCRPRLQTLHIFDARSSYSRHPPLYQRPLQLRLVKLLCCTIMSKSERRDRGAWPSNWSMPVLFGDTVSTLRALAIVPVAWLPGNHFSHLTHLYLSFSMHHDTSLVEQLRRLLTLLSRTAGLSYLQLRDVGQVRDPFSSDATFSQSSEPKRVALSHLRSLIIAESGLRITLSFLDCLDLPGSVLVHLSGMDVNQDPTSIRIPTSPLLISLSRLELFAVERSLHLVAGPSEAYDSSRPFRAGFWMQAKTYREGLDWKPWLSELHTMFQPSSIRTLHVCFRDPELFANILPHMSHLVELGVLFSDSSVAVWEPCIKRLCAVLGDREKITCPRLRVFCLETHVSPETMRCYSRIADMAAMRTHLGHPVRRVAIRAVLPWRPWEKQQGVAALFYGVFSRLGLYVETVEYCGAGDEPLCPFSMHRRWEAADADANDRSTLRKLLRWIGVADMSMHTKLLEDAGTRNGGCCVSEGGALPEYGRVLDKSRLHSIYRYPGYMYLPISSIHRV